MFLNILQHSKNNKYEYFNCICHWTPRLVCVTKNIVQSLSKDLKKQTKKKNMLMNCRCWCQIMWTHCNVTLLLLTVWSLIVLHGTWRGSSNTGNLLHFISLQLSTSLQEVEEKVIRALPHTSHTFNQIQCTLQTWKHSKSRVKWDRNPAFKEEAVRVFTPAASELSGVTGGRWHCLCCTVLWNSTLNSLKESSSTLWL